MATIRSPGFRITAKGLADFNDRLYLIGIAVHERKAFLDDPLMIQEIRDKIELGELRFKTGLMLPIGQFVLVDRHLSKDRRS